METEQKWYVSVASGIAVVSEEPFGNCLDCRDRSKDIAVFNGSYDSEAVHWNLPDGTAEKAYLIGAAPGMLRALKLARKVLPTRDALPITVRTDIGDAIEAIESAIAAAEGGNG